MSARLWVLPGATAILLAVTASAATAAVAETPSQCIARYNALIAALEPPKLPVPATPAAIHAFKLAELAYGQEMQALYKAKTTLCRAAAPSPGKIPSVSTCVGPTAEYTRLMHEPGTDAPAVRAALTRAHARLQSNREEAPRPFALDHFEVTIDQMPPGITPEDFLASFALSPNRTVVDSAFDLLTPFTRRGDGPVGVGTIYDISIPGDAGSVIVVSDKPNQLVVQTITTPETGTHPVSGQREFGFTENPGGSVTFYTNGADRPHDEWLRGIGSLLQDTTWNAMMDGIANRITLDGGKVRPNSIKFWRKDIDAGC